MQDDKEIELEDFEDDDFLDDDALDAEFDLDDLGDLDDLDDDLSDADLDDDLAVPAKNNGSVNKVLVYGLIGVFVLGALFVGFQSIAPLFSGSSQDNGATTQLASVDSDADFAQDAPPMPVPMNNVAEEDIVAQDEFSEPSAPAPALTPLPSLDSPADLDLPPLGGETGQDAVVAAPATPELPELNNSPEPDEALPVLAPNLPGAIEEETLPPPALVAAPDPAPAMKSEDDVLQPIEEVALTDTAPAPTLDQSSAEISAMAEKKIGALANRLDGHDEVLSRIMDSLERIESELETQKGSIEAVSKMAKKIASTPAPVVKKRTVKKKAKAPAKKPVLYDKSPKSSSRSSKTSSSKVTSWVLKSAQPGNAVVAEKGTNYLRGVEVGSSLSGLGKITSISNESGRWIVQGTQGRIVQ